jgi:type IV secretion/conjugal transfer VirB4 family ATPase
MLLKIKDYRDKLKSYSDLLGWFGLIADGVVEMYSGHLLASWYFRGEDLDASSPAELASLSARVNALLCGVLDGSWSVHIDAVRKYTSDYPSRGAFPDRTTFVIDQERRVAYEAEGVHLESLHAITLCWEVPKLAAAKMEGWLFGEGDDAKDAATHHDRMLEKFQEKIVEVEHGLRALFTLRRMRSYVRGQDAQGRDEVYDEQLEFFEYCATLESRPVRLPAVPVYLDRAIGRVGIETEPLIAQVGFGTGNVIRIGERKLVRALTLTGFPDESKPAILKSLDQMGFEYRWNSRYIIMDQHVSEAALVKEQKKWAQKKRPFIDQMKGRMDRVDADAAEMEEQCKAAITEVKSNLVRYGHYTATIIVADESIEALAEKCQTIITELRNQGFSVLQEDVGSADAFIGTMPGNRLANVRGAPTSTLALADMLPLTAIWAGPESHPSPLYPPNSPPLLWCETVGHTPFRLVHHVDDVGHTLMIGPTGAGKTVALNTLIAQHFRYPGARVFGFDRKYGSYVLCKASGGDYYDIAGPNSSLSFAPLYDVKTQADRAWAADWLASCCMLQGMKLSPAQRSLIYKAVETLTTAEGNGRSMSELVTLIQDKDIRTALDHYTLKGQMGELLDGEQDTLATGKFMMFEMEHLADMGEINLVPVLLYLFRQLEKRLDGTPTLVPLDESWLMLSHPHFKSKLAEWLKTWRSKGASLVLATQEPQDVLKSDIKDVVLASCPTRILLANPEAAETQRAMYQLMGCNDTEISIIANAQKKRDYYYKSPMGKRLFSLGLQPVTLAFVGSTGKAAVKEVQDLEAQCGDMWPAEFLVRKGQSEWADYWRRVTA